MGGIVFLILSIVATPTPGILTFAVGLVLLLPTGLLQLRARQRLQATT
jgi:hypothetical protein